jgi:thiosulfate dehydrogenase
VPRTRAIPRLLATSALVASTLGCDSRSERVRDQAAPPTPAQHASAIDYLPPSDSQIPAGPLGESIRRGQALLTRTTDSLPAHAPGTIQCASCHLDAGRRRDAAGLSGVSARFPKFMDRTGAVISIEDRVNYCFTRSLAGRKLPTDSREMRDIVAYFAFISTGVPVGAHVRGEGMPAMPRLSGDSARGAAIYATTCVACHGGEGQGTGTVIPALWGPKSYSIGASMAREERAASFIRHFMPLGAPGTLSDQQAFDVARFVNSHARPDSPGKEGDWPAGGAPYDVPYATAAHVAHRPPARKLFPRADREGSIVAPPRSVRSTVAPSP